MQKIQRDNIHNGLMVPRQGTAQVSQDQDEVIGVASLGAKEAVSG